MLLYWHTTLKHFWIFSTVDIHKNHILSAVIVKYNYWNIFVNLKMKSNITNIWKSKWEIFAMQQTEK